MTRSRRLAAVWFADIEGYTELSSQDEDAALSAVDELQRLSQEAVEAHGGRIVKFLGDGVLTVFDSADAAVRSALKLQEEFSVEDCALRIGVHLGEVVEQGDGDLLGDGVNVASRIEGQAQRGQVVVSEQVYQLLKQQADHSFAPFGPVRLKGVEEAQWLYALGRGSALTNAPTSNVVESSWLYGVITKRWPQAAAAIAIVVGAAKWIVEGLTTDGSMEAYLFAWAVATGGVWFLFDKAEAAMSPRARRQVTEQLRDRDLGHAIRSIPDQFAVLFDGVFGERHLSARCLLRSSVATFVSGTLWSAALYLGLVIYPGLARGAWLGFGDLTLGFAGGYLIGMTLNILPDYLSLLETRWMLAIARFKGWLPLVLVVDFVLTSLIGLGFTVAVVASWPTLPEDPLAPLHVAWTITILMLMASGFFTSIWLWLYAVSVPVSRALLKMNNGVGFLLRVTDVERQPFRSVGFVSVIIVSGLFLMGLPFVLL